MSSLILHRAFASPPARSVVLLAKMLNVNLQYRDVNLLKGEGQTPEFKKLNPMGTVPVLQDGEFTLSESSKMSKLVLYKLDGSPPAGAATIVGEMLGLDFEFRNVNLMGLENKTPEFLKKNPMGTIPVLEDGDFTVSESHAIINYLLAKYGGDKKERMYPSDLKIRAIIDQCQFFNTGVFFIRLKVVALPALLGQTTGPTQKQLDDIELAYGVVENYLASHKYIAADHVTIADISVGMTATTMQSILKLDANKFPRTAAWLARLDQEPIFKKHSDIAVTKLTAALNYCWENNKKK